VSIQFAFGVISAFAVGPHVAAPSRDCAMSTASAAQC
jgi:hypothetical protein